MKFSIVLIGLLTLTFGFSVKSADDASTEPLTKLPLPTATAPLQLYDNPNRIDDVPVCKSKSTMNFYTGRSGTVSAAVTWYTSHLSGFKHVHGIGSDRSQDTFYNVTGTLIVSITGMPGKEGQDNKVYSIIYGTILPGASDKVIAGMNIQKVVCP